MLSKILLLVALLSVAINAKVYFQEEFGAGWEDRWINSDRSGLGKFDVSSGKFYDDVEEAQGLRTSEDAKFYAISATFPEFSNEGKTLVVQFSVKHEQEIDCGGGYVKLMPAEFDQANFGGDTEYNIMFGPDVCGGNPKTHVIFNYDGENHLTTKRISSKTDQTTHVYTLIVNPDKTYEVQIDGKTVEDGNLLDDWEFLPPKEIQDPAFSKPADWVDEAMIDDPEDVKPEGYDDIMPTMVDPDASMPADWDEEDDGEWEAPMITNPEYKGAWTPKKIPNPEYKGPWEHPMIPNPDYHEDDSIGVYSSFGAIGFDLWQVKSGTIFDNIIITDNVEEAQAFMEATFHPTAEQAAFDQYKAEIEAQFAAAEDAEEYEEDDDEYDDMHDEL